MAASTKMLKKSLDSSEDEFGPGDTGVIPPGHNAWVIGNEPVVAIDFTGLKDYARR
jgi:hypothetical protein